jgi:hypothetical protein
MDPFEGFEVACGLGDLVTLKELLNAYTVSIELGIQLYSTNICLHNAIAGGHFGVVKWLMERFGSRCEPWLVEEALRGRQQDIASHLICALEAGAWGGDRGWEELDDTEERRMEYAVLSLRVSGELNAAAKVRCALGDGVFKYVLLGIDINSIPELESEIIHIHSEISIFPTAKARKTAISMVESALNVVDCESSKHDFMYLARLSPAGLDAYRRLQRGI